MERFGNACHDEIQKLMDKSRNNNPAKVTATWMNVYHTEKLEIQKVEPKKLDEILHFFTELKNKTDKITSLILYVLCKLR